MLFLNVAPEDVVQRSLRVKLEMRQRIAHAAPVLEPARKYIDRLGEHGLFMPIGPDQLDETLLFAAPSRQTGLNRPATRAPGVPQGKLLRSRAGLTDCSFRDTGPRYRSGQPSWRACLLEVWSCPACEHNVVGNTRSASSVPAGRFWTQLLPRPGYRISTRYRDPGGPHLRGLPILRERLPTLILCASSATCSPIIAMKCVSAASGAPRTPTRNEIRSPRGDANLHVETRITNEPGTPPPGSPFLTFEWS